MKTVSLVLGSGGARGLAHIGIIHWLEENGYEIKSISGCSMGALVGGIYASGKLSEFEHWVKAVTKMDIITLLDISWSTTGFFKGDKVINTLVDLVGNQLIEDLPIRYTAIAADLTNEKEIWINSGELFNAIRASISLPMLFTPYNYKGVNLIDGGVLNPVPIAPTFGDGTDVTIAVNLCGSPKNAPTIDDKLVPVSTDTENFHEKITGFIKTLQQKVIMKDGIDLDAYDIVNQAFDAMQSTIARQKLAAYPPDYTIELARNACGTLEFERAAEMIELGYQKAAENLNSISSDH
ncbi:patatin-like phospholipase family protein [Nitrosomonas sp.]|uniref:patatin-like phospholipase family protein n=1 Tax=Nitrosomonas sp. TaxID=42353 RepID=UPI001DC4637C|nr:patatin-like phospholipase family protein [Nitrosomonas sp.]MCB1948717.1 patatin-like phospholipase family protein [Nitrosomonas sp.]MCP5243688.1 patatin-like phospholipase family protein [Burkholderiales bacterium]MDR4515535.1 patatin-like phospholipase family protein [Nitrosomonas sp.]